MLTQEQKHQIMEAIELVQQAQELVDEAISGSDVENHYLAYGRYGFDRLLNNGNPYDYGLQELISPVKEI